MESYVVGVVINGELTCQKRIYATSLEEAREKYIGGDVIAYRLVDSPRRPGRKAVVTRTVRRIDSPVHTQSYWTPERRKAHGELMRAAKALKAKQRALASDSNVTNIREAA